MIASKYLTGVCRFIVLMIAWSSMLGSASAQVACGPAHSHGILRSAPHRARVVVISGTNRDGSNTLKVSKYLVEVLEKQGAQVDLLDIAQVPPSTYSGTNYFNTPKKFQKNYDQKIETADAVFVVYPEYNGTYPGILGTFLNYMQASLESKPIGMIGLSAGMLGGQKGAEHLSSTLRHRRADVIGEAQVNMPNVETLITENTVSNNGIAKRIEKAAQALIARVRTAYDLRAQINDFLELAKSGTKSLQFTLNSGTSIYGKLTEVIRDSEGQPIFLKWSGPTEIRDSKRLTISGQGIERHAGGFSNPIGKIKTDKKLVSLSEMHSLEELSSIGLVLGQKKMIKFESGIELEATLQSAQFSPEGELQVLIFDQATMTYQNKTLYKPNWGPLDMAVGERISNIQL